MTEDTPTTDSLPSAPGSYVLWLQLPKPACMAVGRLGKHDFAAGYYAYTGSALGPGGLAARLRHHLGVSPRPHWHLDYLRRRATPREAWVLLDDRNHEHRLAELLAACQGAGLPVPGFGSSDCSCAAHLVHFACPPRLRVFNGQTTHHATLNTHANNAYLLGLQRFRVGRTRAYGHGVAERNGKHNMPANPIGKIERFDPFADRKARDIRNSLSAAFVRSLQQADPAAFIESAARWLGDNPPPLYAGYIRARRVRYSQTLDFVRRRQVRAPLVQALVIWNAGLFFELHEHLEVIWQQESGDLRQALKGLIQAAGVYVHQEEGNSRAARGLALRATALLESHGRRLTCIGNLDDLLAGLASPENPPPRLHLAVTGDDPNKRTNGEIPKPNE